MNDAEWDYLLSQGAVGYDGKLLVELPDCATCNDTGLMISDGWEVPCPNCKTGDMIPCEWCRGLGNIAGEGICHRCDGDGKLQRNPKFIGGEVDDVEAVQWRASVI